MNNIGIKIFQKKLYDLINSCGLPVGIAYFVLKDATNELEKTFNECAYKESCDDNKGTQTQTIEMPFTNTEEQKENLKNEQSKTNASANSGSINDN